MLVLKYMADFRRFSKAKKCATEGCQFYAYVGTICGCCKKKERLRGAEDLKKLYEKIKARKEFLKESYWKRHHWYTRLTMDYQTFQILDDTLNILYEKADKETKNVDNLTK